MQISTLSPLFDPPLPQELDDEILAYLDIRDLYQARAVSQSWNQRVTPILEKKPDTKLYEIVMANLKELFQENVLHCKNYGALYPCRRFHITLLLEERSGQMWGYQTRDCLKEAPDHEPLKIRKYQIVALHDNLRMEECEKEAYTFQQPAFSYQTSAYPEDIRRRNLFSAIRGIISLAAQVIFTTFQPAAHLPETCKADRVANTMLSVLNKAAELAFISFIENNGIERSYNYYQLKDFKFWQSYMTFELCQSARYMSKEEYETLVQQRQSLDLPSPSLPLVIQDVKPSQELI